MKHSCKHKLSYEHCPGPFRGSYMLRYLDYSLYNRNDNKRMIVMIIIIMI